MPNFNQILEMVHQLDEEQQELLTTIVQRRLHEARRKQIAESAKITLAEFRSGKLLPMTADEILDDISQYLSEEE